MCIRDSNGSLYTLTNNFNYEGTNKLITDLVNKAKKFFNRNNITKEHQKIEVYMEAHYPFQVYELAIDITDFLD